MVAIRIRTSLLRRFRGSRRSSADSLSECSSISHFQHSGICRHSIFVGKIIRLLRTLAISDPVWDVGRCGNSCLARSRFTMQLREYTADFFIIRHHPHSLYHEYRHDHRPFQLSCDTNLHPGADFDNGLRNNHHLACRNDYRNFDGSDTDPSGSYCDGNNCIDGSR